MKTYSTGQVANICKVAPRTVSKWFDSGRLKGYRIPGTQDRRIPHEHLIKFLKEHGMPFDDIGGQVKPKLDPLKPSASLLSKLGSIAVHSDELLSNDGHDFDRAAIESLIEDPEVSDWISQMNGLALLPLKRS